MLEGWERSITSPRERLLRCLDILRNEEQAVVRYGCPMGTLTAELGKDQPALQGQAREMFQVFFIWLTRQFEALGHAGEARELALHVLARMQGIAAIAHAFADLAFLRRETAALRDWTQNL